MHLFGYDSSEKNLRLELNAKKRDKQPVSPDWKSLEPQTLASAPAAAF